MRGECDDNCAFLTFDTFLGDYRCKKGHDPYCQDRKLLPCLDYINLGTYMARKALKSMREDAIKRLKEKKE